MKTQLFERLVKALKVAGIRYAVVGNTEEYPEAIGSDVDFVVLPEDLPQFQAVVWGLNRQGVWVVQRIQHEVSAFYYVVASVSDTGIFMLQPDVCSDYFRRGIRLLTARDLLQDVVPAVRANGDAKGFDVLSASSEFVYYLVKKIDKESIDNAQFAHLVRVYRQDSIGAQRWLRQFWTEATAARMADMFERADLVQMQAGLFDFKLELRSRVRFPLRDRLKRLGMQIRRILAPTGLVVWIPSKGDEAVAGANAMVEHLAGAFRRCRVLERSAFSGIRRLGLPVVVSRARICSTLVVVLSRRCPWWACPDLAVLREQPNPVSDAFQASCGVFDFLSARLARRCGLPSERTFKE